MTELRRSAAGSDAFSMARFADNTVRGQSSTREMEEGLLSTENVSFSRDPYVLSLMEVSVSVSVPKKGAGRCAGKEFKPILDEVIAEFVSNEIVAVMGPSGSGKSTLLSVLAGNIESSSMRRVDGEFLVNDGPCTPIAFKQVCSLIPQDDVLLPGLTVMETYRYAAEVRSE